MRAANVRLHVIVTTYGGCWTSFDSTDVVATADGNDIPLSLVVQ